MVSRIGVAVLMATTLLAGAVLLGSDRPINIALPPDHLTPEERMPLETYLTKEMGRPIHIVTPESYQDTIDGLARGSLDFACTGGVTYVRARARAGVVPLVQRTSDQHFHSVFITGTNSPIHSLRDLRGKQFAFGDKYSTSGTIIPFLELKQAGLNPKADMNFRYSGSHPLTVVLVENGTVDAGAVDETVYKSLLSDGKIDGSKTRIFYTSKPFVDYVYVARKDVPEADQKRLAHALLALKQGRDDSVLKILRAEQFVEANDAEYARIREIVKELDLF